MIIVMVIIIMVIAIMVMVVVMVMIVVTSVVMITVVIAIMVMTMVISVVVVIIVVMVMRVVSGLPSEKNILVRQNMTPLVAVAHNTIANCTIIRQNSVGAHHLILCVVAKVTVSEVMACNRV